MFSAALRSQPCPRQLQLQFVPVSALTSSSLQYANIGGTKRRISSTGVRRAEDEQENVQGGGFGGMTRNEKKSRRPGGWTPYSPNDLRHPLFSSVARSSPVLPRFEPEFLSKDTVGTAVNLSTHAQTQFGVPKSVERDFKLLSKPGTVIRESTLTVIDLLDKAKDTESVKTRRVLTGRPGCGKSTVLLQAVEYAVSQGWIVLYVPRAIDFLNSTCPYTYDARTRTYHQPQLAYSLLNSMLSVNKSALRRVRTTRDVVLRTGVVAAGTPLVDLVGAGLTTTPVGVLDALLGELERQYAYPVLVAVDDVQALYCPSAYRDPQFDRIRAHHLAVPRMLLECAGGMRSFARGAFLSAPSSTNTSFPTPLELTDALAHHPYAPSAREHRKGYSPGPYTRRNADVAAYAKGLQRLDVGEELSVDEAAGVFGMWAGSKALFTDPTDDVFLARYTEASGNARDFVWKGILASHQT